MPFQEDGFRRTGNCQANLTGLEAGHRNRARGHWGDLPELGGIKRGRGRRFIAGAPDPRAALRAKEFSIILWMATTRTGNHRCFWPAPAGAGINARVPYFKCFLASSDTI